MAKKQLNKMLVLPLFLAGVTLLSAGVLTGVNLLTAPFIETNELNKKYEGYKQILEIDAFDRLVEHEVSSALLTAGIKMKQEFYINDGSVGVVYDGEIKGWENGLIFQVGFKDEIYAGFNLISSNETPGIGADYLRLVDGRIKGKGITEPVLVDDDGTYTGVTAPFTGEPLKVVLELCAADYASGGDVDPVDPDEHEPAALADLQLALNNEAATSYRKVELDGTLAEDGIVYIYEMLNDEEVIGYVYEAIVDGFKPDLQFLVSFNKGVYAGFHVLESKETPTWGGEYLDALNDALVGLDAAEDVTVLLPDITGISATRNPVEKALGAAAAHYGEYFDHSGKVSHVASALNNDDVDGYVKYVATGDLADEGVTYCYLALDGDKVIGYAYEALVSGFKPGLQFIVGFANEKYAGFHVIATKETPTWGGEYLDALNDALVGLDASEDVTVLLPDITGISATRNPVEKALAAASAHYVLNYDSSTLITHLKAALNIAEVTTVSTYIVDTSLQSAGIVHKYIVNGNLIVYEAIVNGFKPNLHFMVGFSAGKYAGFHVIKSAETPTWGGEYLDALNDALIGLAADEDVTVLLPDITGISGTRNPVEGALIAAGLDYLGGLE